MISLQAHLFSLIEFKNLKEVDRILGTASSNITFWGKRILKADGFSGSVTIDKVTQKIIRVPVVGYYLHGFSQSALREKIMIRLDELYLESDQIMKTNCLRGCFVSVRDDRKLRAGVEGQYFPMS